MNEETTTKLLEKEYFHLQSTIENFDAKSLTIKAWSVSLTGTIAGSGAFFDKSELLLFAALIAFMFWMIDTSWKTFQRAFVRRVSAIEAHMRGETPPPPPLQINQAWKQTYSHNRLKTFYKVMFWHHVFLPHGALALVLTGVYAVVAC